MKTRIAAWTSFVVCAQVLIGCGGSNAPYDPVNPSPPPPPITIPPSPPDSLAVDLTGNYALTFEAGSACEQVPTELKTRTYKGTIGYYKSVGSADWFRVELSGANSYQPVVIEVTGNSVSVDLSDNVIVEEPAPGAYLATAGYGVASVQPTELSTISGSFTGFFKYCVETSGTGATNTCSIDTMVRGMCRSDNSRWTLTRR